VISHESIQQILSKIDIIEIIGSFVKLKKRGTNYLGLCPFHNEKTPSFTVSPSKEIYKCFGCGRSGNSISFIMEHEKYSYVEALRLLAAKYNVLIEETELSPEVKIQQQVADSLHIINSFAQKFFAHGLLETGQGIDIGLTYLKQRGFREEIIKKFQLGFSPEEKNAFAKAAVTNQFNQEYLIKSGLVVLRNDELLDNYRGRIIFPVHSTTGKIIGFGARLIKSNDKAPKYINTPENEVYSKSKILYGTWFARQAIDKSDECLLVEGYTDVISLHQAGIENVVASGGTSLTIDQLRLIRKYTNNLTIIYDGDVAGVKAALRGLDMALEEGLNVKLVLIPGNEDPDSYVNKIGSAAFSEFVAANKKDFILFQLEVSLHEAGNDSAKKAAVVNQVAETISKINKAEDFSKQQDYIRKCSELMRIDENGLNSLVNQFTRERITKQESKQAADHKKIVESSEAGKESDYDDNTFKLLYQDELQERGLVKALIEFGSYKWTDDKKLADYILEEAIEIDLFDNFELKKIFEDYRSLYVSGYHPQVRDFIHSPDLAVSTLIISITNFPYELSPVWKEEHSDAIFKDEVKKQSDYYVFKDMILTTEGQIKTSAFKDEKDEFEMRYVFDAVMYLKIKKVKKLIYENQKDLEQPHTDEEQKVLMQTHQHLKEMERDTLKKKQTVYLGK